MPAHISKVWNNIVKNYGEMESAPTTPASSVSDSDESLKASMNSVQPQNAVEKAFKDSFQQRGAFDTRGSKLAYEFDKARKADSDLNKSYVTTVGNLNKADFRAKWVSDMWANIVRKRTETHSLSSSERCDGVFKPMKVWIDDLGSNQDAIEGVHYFLKKVDRKQTYK